MQSRHSSKGEQKAGEIGKQQYKINPQLVFVNSASNDTVIYAEAKREQTTDLPLAL